jgi:hypothetical protein
VIELKVPYLDSACVLVQPGDCPCEVDTFAEMIGAITIDDGSPESHLCTYDADCSGCAGAGQTLYIVRFEHLDAFPEELSWEDILRTFDSLCVIARPECLDSPEDFWRF